MSKVITKEKIQIEHNLFIPWILEDYGDQEIAEAWGSGVSIEDFCISHAGLLPIQHIRNWEDVMHHFDDEPYNGKEINYSTGKLFTSWSEYYEEDGYVHGLSLPDTLEIEWVYEGEENAKS